MLRSINYPTRYPTNQCRYEKVLCPIAIADKARLINYLTRRPTDRCTHFNLRTDQVQQRIGPEPFTLADLPADLLSPHAAQDTDFLPG